MPAKPKAAAPSAWRNRIVGHGEEAPDQLLANPMNWRAHPKAQQDALSGELAEIGWVQQVLVNQRTGYVIDGHLRVALAISREEPMVPVLYVDLNEAEEMRVLAALDPLAAMAVMDQEKLAELLGEVAVDNELFRQLAYKSGQIVPDFGPDGIENQGRLDQKAPVTCPECGHVFTP